MNNNLYWAVYKNLEREVTELANLIHFDDEQLEVYSIKISELLLRSVVEVESIAKELYFLNSGGKPDNNDLYFDTDCIDLIETKWKVSKKQVLVSAFNFYFKLDDNRILTPLNKANKRGSSSSDWLKAYQAVKHNRVRNLSKGNIRNLIRAMAGLYILNVYYKDTIYDLEKDFTATNFDNSLGSTIFSIKIHVNTTISADSEYTKNIDFDECVYVLKPTDKTRDVVKEWLKNISDITNERIKAELAIEIHRQFSGIEISSQEETEEKIKTAIDKFKSVSLRNVAQENGQVLKKSFDDLKYEGILNKQQY